MSEFEQTHSSGDPTKDYTCSRDYHLFANAPKRLLALDGGGLRGAISVAFLERIEKVLDDHFGRQIRLGDFFDLVGGTSTGAIIAGAIALGYRASEIKDFYLRLAPNAFRRRLRIPFLQAKFDARGLRAEIDGIVQNRTLESDDLITGLAIVAKRIDTGSPWIVANNPMSKWWDSAVGHLANKDYKLATLVRASTAAPLYFDPQIIPIEPEAPKDPFDDISAPFKGYPWLELLFTKARALYGAVTNRGPTSKTHGLFIDGGVTPYNNPVMALLMLVALRQFGICWPLGVDNLSIISIGTGSFRTSLSFAELGIAGPLKLAKAAMLSSMSDAQSLALAQMQWLGRCDAPWRINAEWEDIKGNEVPGGDWFRFQRYDVELTPRWLQTLYQRSATVDAKSLQRMDDLSMVQSLYEVGQAAADAQVNLKHLLSHNAL